MNRIIKEPIFYFLTIGVLIFIIDAAINKDLVRTEDIIITSEDINRLTAQYQQNWGEPPTSEVLEKLVQDYIDAEIFYKEALKLNLDHNDEIIKRRLRQKYEFVAQDLADVVEPSQEELESFFNDRAEDYMDPLRLSFRHCYINPDINDDVEERAKQLLQRIDSSNLNQVGDNSHIPSVQSNVDIRDISRIFGSSFADDIFNQPVLNQPKIIGSGYGLHIVIVDDVAEKKFLAFEEVMDDVIIDWQVENREQFKDQLIKSVREQYKVVRRDEL